MKTNKNYTGGRSIIRQLSLLFFFAITILLGSSLFFYRVSYQSLLNKEAKYTETVLSQVSQGTENVLSSVKLMLNTVASSPYAVDLLKEQNATKKFQYKQSINRLTTEMVRSNSNIVSILLLDMEGKVCSHNGYDYSLANQLEHLYHIYSPETYRNGISGELHLPDSDSHFYSLLTSVFDPGKPETDENRCGFCLVLCSAEPLLELCLETVLSKDSSLLILDHDNRILANTLADDKDLETAIVQILPKSETDFSGSGRIRGARYLIQQFSSVSEAGWKTASVIPYADIIHDLSLINSIAVVLIVIFLLTFFFLMSYIRRNLTSPLIGIFDFMQKGPSYTLHHKLPVRGSSEIRDISANINEMLDQINEMSHTALYNQSRLYEIELSNNRARLEALQSQINPHFLYNTLSMIRGLTFADKNEEIRTAISALAHIMRYSIKGEEIVTVRDELTCIQKYLEIMDIRFSHRFIAQIEIDQDIYDYEMPRFLLQPLVENAIFHGLEPRPGEGTLSVSIYVTPENRLHLTCSDNGKGIPPEKLESLQAMLASSLPQNGYTDTTAHIGLLNIYQRLKLLYGDEASMNLASQPGVQTTVSVCFPSSKKEIF